MTVKLLSYEEASQEMLRHLKAMSCAQTYDEYVRALAGVKTVLSRYAAERSWAILQLQKILSEP